MLLRGFLWCVVFAVLLGNGFISAQTVSGDGLDVGEQCDDNNDISGDGCSNFTIDEGYGCIVNFNFILLRNVSMCSPVCGDGRLIDPEVCDDNNTRTGDGCSDVCVIEDQFECTQDVNGVSVCEAILLDLNAFDATSLDYMNEYFDLSTIVFLSDPNLTNMTTIFLSPLGGNWTSVYLFILGADPTFRQEAGVYTREAYQAGRTATDYTGTFSITELNLADPLVPRNIGGMPLARAYRIFGDRNFYLGDHDEELSADEVYGALRSIGYMADDSPGYGPRRVCVTAEDSMYSTTACVSLYFIGHNENRPTVTYVGGEVANFTEGQTEPVKFVVGSLTVNDTDHPTRYLMQSAEASIVGFLAGQAEEIALTYQLPDFTYQFSTTTGALTITGNATADTYTEILSNLTYINNMMEPAGTSRTIQITVSDGSFTSNQLHITVNIVNVNDAPVVSLNGEDPVITAFSSSYTEGTGAQTVLSNLFVVDTDPMPMIQRVVVELTNPVDGERESIAVGDTQGLTLSNTSHFVELSGQATPQMYTAVLRTLTYEHSDADPGNPTSTTARQIMFYVEDDQGASPPQNSTLTLTIVPVNDGPILFFVADETIRTSPAPILEGETVQSFNYTEDDPAINIGQDIYLRDVDGDIMSATVRLSGLLNGNRDHFYFDNALLTLYGVNQTTFPGDGEREIVLTGQATSGWYEQILRSLNYRNVYMNDSVTDGQRNVTIFVRDTGSIESGNITAYVIVMDRNDGPVVTLTDEEDSMTVFVENGPSVPIGFFHLIQVMDEEGNNISSLDVNLIAINGNLDPEETIFPRSPMFAQFVTDPTISTTVTQTSIHIETNARPELYVQALQSVYYNNRALEPTLFNETGSNLTRQVVVTITDAVVGSQTTTEFRVTILTESINDNRPRIIISTFPSCSEDGRDSPDGQTARSRRDTRAAGRRRKRAAYDLMEEDSMAPRLKTAKAHFITDSCLSNITLLFNTNTSVPIVEIQPDLGYLLHLDPPEVDKASHRGYWLDYQTLVITFQRCVPWEGVTTSGRDRPMFVMFEAQRGSCDWSSPCSSGVCFSNATGCPVTGLHPITTNHSTLTPTHRTCTDDTVWGSRMYYQSGLVTFVVIILAVMVMGLALSHGPARNGQSPSQSQVDQVEAGTLPPKSSKPVPVVTEGSVAVQISPSKESGVQDVMPGKVERISTVAMKTEETPREPASVSKATRISPGHGSRKKAQTRSPPKKGPPDSSKVTLDGDPERGGIPTRVPVMAAGGEDHVGEEPIASEDEQLLTLAQGNQHTVQEVHHRVCHTHNQGPRSRDLVASGNQPPSREQSSNSSNSYGSIPPDRQYTGSQNSTH